MPRLPSRLIVTLVGPALVMAACGQASPSTAARLDASPTVAAPAGPSASVTSSPPERTPVGLRVTAVLSPIRLPSGLSRSVALALGPDLLVCGGLTNGGTTSSILRVDLGSGRVSPIGVLSTAVHDAGGTVLDGVGYVVGGGNLVAETTIQRIDSAGRATLIGQLPAARADLAVAAVDGEIVIIGGGAPARPDDRVLGTTDGKQVHPIGRLVVAVRYPAVAVVGGRVIVIGGSTSNGDSNLIQAFDPALGKSWIIGHLASPMSHATALVIGGVVLIAGGRIAGRAQDRILELSLANGATTTVGRLPYAVSDAAGVVVDGTGYLIGGETSRPVPSVVIVSTR